MYRLFRGLVLRIFRAPEGEPTPPGGPHAKVEIFRASPRFLTYRLLAVGFGLIVTLGAAVIFSIAALVSGEPGLLIPAVLIGGFGLCACSFAYFVVHLDYDLRYYVFTERSLRVREGAWTVREKTITYANVQNLNLRQGPLQRLLGIRDLRIDTAGGGGAEPGSGQMGGHSHSITVAGVENGAELRDRILAHIKSLGVGSGLGDPDDENGLARSSAVGSFGGAGGSPGPEVQAALVGVAEAARRLRLACEARGA